MVLMIFFATLIFFAKSRVEKSKILRLMKYASFLQNLRWGVLEIHYFQCFGLWKPIVDGATTFYQLAKSSGP